jgi:hypothetical protein
MSTDIQARYGLAIMLTLALTGCGPSGNVPSNVALTDEQQQFGAPQVEVKTVARTPLEVLSEGSYTAAGAVPVILSKSNAHYVENVFKTQPTLDQCVKLMQDHVKRVRKPNSKEVAAYYCVPVQNGIPETPVAVAKFDA